ncbi:MAG: ABC transporter ATP-binding protein [Myxococcota bacterium]
MSPDSESLGASLDRLGRGGAEDRLTFKLVLRIAARSVPLLRPIWKEIRRIIPVLLLLVPVSLVWGATFASVFSNGLLLGSAISNFQARLFLLSPDEFATGKIEETRGIDETLVKRAAAGAGLALSDLEVPRAEGDLEIRTERGNMLLAYLEDAHPQILPVEINWRFSEDEPEKAEVWHATIAARLTPENRRTLRGRIVVWLVVSSVVGTPIAIAFLLWALRLIQRVNQALRVDLMDRIQSLSLQFHSDSRIGDSIYRLYQDSAMVTNLMNTIFLQPISRIFSFSIAIGVAFLFDPWLAGLLLLVCIPVFLLTWRYSSPFRVGFRDARETNSYLTSRIQETLSGIKAIKAFGAERAEQGRFEDASSTAFRMANVVRSRLAGFRIFMFFIAGTALIYVDYDLALRTAEQLPTWAAGLFTFLGFAVWNYGAYSYARGRVGGGIRNPGWMANLWARAQDMAVGMDRVFELLSAKPEIEDAPDAIPLPGLENEIRFRGVSFHYKPDRPVLHDVEFTVRPGSITAIVGPTGVGKTTLVSLLLRLFDPKEGQIEIDGVDLRRFQVKSLRANVAIALQQNVLFGATIRENIRYAVPDASHAQVVEAARVACADRFIEALPGGYDTALGERGSKLSSGQRQRLSIARAIIKDTPILVLDEPTAALDAETELAVLANLAGWGRGRAIFLVTHRLSTIRRADQIIFLRDGTVQESGSHDDLVALPGGAYRSFVELEEDREVQKETA